MFRRLICGVIAASCVALAPTAQAEDPAKIPVLRSRAVQGPPTTFSSAKLTALISSIGEIINEKGVAFITHTAGSGIYCIFPLNSTLIANLNRIAPVVSIDFGTSPNSFVAAQWNSGVRFARACTGNSIEVRTIDFPSLGPRDEGFTIVVP